MSLRLGQVSNKSNVKVRVSLSNRAVYLCEGDEIKWAAAVAIGTPSNPTPQGNFRAFNKPAPETLEYLRILGERFRDSPR